MSTIDPLGNSCDRRLRIHIRRMHHQTYESYEGVRCAQKVFGSIGVLVDVASVQSAAVPLRQVGRFAAIQGPWARDTTDADRWSMYNQFGVQDLASITVFLVHSLSPSTNSAGIPRGEVAGAAASPVQRPTVYLGFRAGPWDLAHELAHTLLHTYLPVHEKDPNNLMWPSSRWDPSTPTLNAGQTKAIREHGILLPC